MAWDADREAWSFRAVAGPAGTAGMDLTTSTGEPWFQLEVDMVDPTRVVGLILEATNWWPSSDPWLPDSIRSRLRNAERAGSTIDLDLSGTRLGDAFDHLGWIARLSEDLLELLEPRSKQLCGLELLDRYLRAKVDPGPQVEQQLRALANETEWLRIGADEQLAHDIMAMQARCGVPTDRNLLTGGTGGVFLGRAEKSSQPATSSATVAQLQWSTTHDAASFTVTAPIEGQGRLFFSAGVATVEVPTRPGLRPTVILFDDTSLPVAARILDRAGDDGRATGRLYPTNGAPPATIYAGPSPDRRADLTYLEQLERAIGQGRAALYVESRDRTNAAAGWENAAHHYLGVGHIPQAVLSLRRQALVDEQTASERAGAWASAWAGSWPEPIPATPDVTEPPLWIRASRPT